jgi:EAL domain-containing protein (putative c-di-GMP-specific phosphodiesterase class I)
VARLGGDEFAIILGELHDVGSVDRIANIILQKLAVPFQLAEQAVYISTSIGITYYPEDAMDFEGLLQNAEQAMYAAKQEGRNRYSFYAPYMQEVAQSRMRVSNDLRVALGRPDSFSLVYQPIVDLATGVIRKAEALIRWHHPVHGITSPAEFIPIAEETEMILEIGEWVFHEAADQVARWRKIHHELFQVSINVSPVQFHKSGIMNNWHEYLHMLALPGNSMVVEITEGLLLQESDRVRKQIREFQKKGIEVSLDDFGTGYSSLSYLKKFNIDNIKIDQSFVRNLAPESDDMVLCEAMIAMAHKLGIKVIAEGIETQVQRDLLIRAGCDYGQGYFFSRPVAAEEFDQFLCSLKK